ncbi:uncharacterized protein FIBRA_09026 [Fibroporia radiculosa]|uniref:Uncharacterized protein n=1 Tax=Fibroporia radiculosa TaxID=599839 RepID=J4I3P6_9APHY|nr:uncharacterized protein FIBRA_09026 [Fibroporia radiculosa]CCM06732.1 predicted protein [Fibroporia radiculosa]
MQPTTESGASTSTPPANAPTPINAATPINMSTPIHVASSPQTPNKSPKAKPTPKPRAREPTKRRSKTSSTPVGPSIPVPSPMVVPSPSSPTKAETPAAVSLTSSEQPPAAASTPPVPFADSRAGKRQRDDEPVVVGDEVNNAPSPKKAKTGTEGEQLSDASPAHKPDMEPLETDEDVVKFFEQMHSMLQMIPPDDGNGPQISQMFSQILKGCGDSTDPLPELGGLGEENIQATSAPQQDVLDFFDFSSFGTDEEVGSKAATPELMQASSTNPSPGSGSEADAAHSSSTGFDPARIVSGDEGDSISEMLRLGTWKEIDGGESAYYQSSDGWKWDAPMHASDSAWAIYTT